MSATAKKLAKRELPLYRTPSASKAEAFLKCPSSAILPGADRGGEHRDVGTEAHEALAGVINKRVPQTTLRGILAIRDFDLGAVLKKSDTHKAEAAYAVNVKTKTSRFLGLDLGRNYGPLKPFEIPCTIDVHGLTREGRRPWIRDWKFGSYASWTQVLVQCAAVMYGDIEDDPEGECDAGFCFIDPDTHGADHFEDSRIVHLEEVDQCIEGLYQAWCEIEEHAAAWRDEQIVPPATIGAWCKYCPSIVSCPSQMSMVKALTDTSVRDIMVEKLGELSPVELGNAWAKTRQIRDLLERIEDAIKAAATQSPVPLPSGKVLRMVEASGRSNIDKGLAYALVRRLGGTDEDFKSIVKRGKPYMTAKETKK